MNWRVIVLLCLLIVCLVAVSLLIRQAQMGPSPMVPFRKEDRAPVPRPEKPAPPTGAGVPSPPGGGR